jgi:hypothetical protein
VDKALVPHPPQQTEGGCASLIHPTFVNSVWLKH